MAKVEIYTTQICPYCVRAKDLLQRKGITPEEVRIDLDTARLAEMLERSGGRRTVPQIFIDGTHVGGCDDLYALESGGKLDGMLSGGA